MNNNTISPVLELINAKTTKTFSLPLAEAIGINAAIVYSALVAKMAYYEKMNKLVNRNGKLWFFSTVDDLRKSTTLKKDVQFTILKKLEKYNLINVAKFGLPQKRYFSINPDVSCLEKILSQVLQDNIVDKEENDIATNGENTGFAPIVGNPANLLSENPPTSSRKTRQLLNIRNKTEEDKTIQSVKDEINDKDIYTALSDKTDKITTDNIILQVKRQVDYSSLVKKYSKENLNCWIKTIADVFACHSPTMRISKSELSTLQVQERYRQINSETLSYAIDEFNSVTNPIRNISAYTKACLYKAPTTVHMRRKQNTDSVSCRSVSYDIEEYENMSIFD